MDFDFDASPEVVLADPGVLLNVVDGEAGEVKLAEVLVLAVPESGMELEVDVNELVLVDAANPALVEEVVEGDEDVLDVGGAVKVAEFRVPGFVNVLVGTPGRSLATIGARYPAASLSKLAHITAAPGCANWQKRTVRPVRKKTTNAASLHTVRCSNM